MNARALGLLSAVGLALALGAVTLVGQGTADTSAAHIASAKAAAGTDHAFIFNTLCNEALGALGAPPAPATAPAPAPAPGAPRTFPDRAGWHAEPVKVFDNLYWLGTIEISAWAIVTSDGIILMDAIFDYAIQDEVVDGLRKLGLNPASIKYAIVAHGHSDHVGGAKLLQDEFGTRIVLSADDWNLLDRTGPTAGSAGALAKPKRDVVATDGMKITLGDTTVTMYVTPGHTQGTLSSIFTVKDGGTPHVVAYWGGTLYNWIRQRGQYITPSTPDKFWFDAYSSSAARFRGVAAAAGADVLMSNHTLYDGSKAKMPRLATRKAGEAHPYVIGKESLDRFLSTVGECAKAGSLRTEGR